MGSIPLHFLLHLLISGCFALAANVHGDGVLSFTFCIGSKENPINFEKLKIFHTFSHLLDETDAKLLAEATESILEKPSPPAMPSKSSKAKANKKPAEHAEPTDEEVLARLFV